MKISCALVIAIIIAAIFIMLIQIIDRDEQHLADLKYSFCSFAIDEGKSPYGLPEICRIKRKPEIAHKWDEK